MLGLANRRAYTTLLSAAFIQQADDQPALCYIQTDAPAQVTTRAQLRQAILAAGACLRDEGVQAGDRVIIAHTQNLTSIEAFWGALAIGAIPTMFPTLTEKLDPTIYQRNMTELVSLIDARLILTTAEFAPQLRAVAGCDVLSHATWPTAPLAALQPAPPDTIAFLQHSSGTTGLQKGVALTHQAVLNQLASYSDALALNGEDVIVSWLPLYHDMGLIAGFLLPLIQGIPLVLMSPFDWVQHPALLLRAIDEYRGTLCWLPNFAYNHCARRIRQRDSDGRDLSSMRLFINCSEPVSEESHTLFLERFAPNGIRREHLAVSYAMAENTFAVTQTPMGQAARLDIIDRVHLEKDARAVPVPADHADAVIRVSCGPPIAHTMVQVVDERGQSLPDRTIGQVAIRSDCMLSEYYRRPDLNPFYEGWCLTGDMGYIADGEVYIVGRMKDLIINAGKNVYPQDLEAIINDVPGVKPGRAVVFGVPDLRQGTELIGVIAEVQTNDPDERRTIEQAIRQFIVTRASVTITYIALVDERWLIKTSSGKIARNANRDKWLAEHTSLR